MNYELRPIPAAKAGAMHWVVLLVFLASVSALVAQDISLDEKPDANAKAAKGAAAKAAPAGKKESLGGGIEIELVGPDGKSIEDKRFVRRIPGQYSVVEFPHVMFLEGQELFAAGTKLESAVQSSAVGIQTESDPDLGESLHYRARSAATIQPGKYAILPFDLKFEITGDGKLLSASPALTVSGASGKTLQINVVPVTFRAVNAAKGYAVPLVGFGLAFGNTNLLERLIPDEDHPSQSYCPITMYLPRGLKYSSSAGPFEIDDGGKVASTSGNFKDGAFVVSVSAAAAAHEPIAKGYWLLSHNLRRVFKRGEIARFHVIISGQYPQATLAVTVTAGDKTQALGTVDLPAVTETDSAMLMIDTARLAPGKYQLGLGHADSKPFTFEVVELLAATPEFLHTVSCCNGADFDPETDEGLTQMAHAGISCWVTYGHQSLLARTTVKSEQDKTAGAPSELRAPVPAMRVLLENTLRHGLTMIDYENRCLGFYNEGLAFHHSYGPSVERLVRRVQVFMQEVEDYPACIGLTYTWFPCLGGYVEGGVPCDPYFGSRMAALYAQVKEKFGLEPMAAKERTELQKTEDAARKRELTDQARQVWRAEQEVGWQGAFSTYNKALREVRADYVATMSENNGHDRGKSIHDMGVCNTAMSFENYTDYGDWPNSTGWNVDWVHAQLPDKPLWLTADGTQTDPAICAKAMYAFARGCEGVGVPLRGPTMPRANRIRGLLIDFFKRYGPLVTEFSRQGPVAIMGNEISFPQYSTHALHSHLMRLGYAPTILWERTVEAAGDVPPYIKVLLLPNVRQPFSAACEKGLKAFVARGGKLISIGEKSWPIEGAKVVDVPLKELWDVGGFNQKVHVAFWHEFHVIRPTLEKTLAEAGVTPVYGADPNKAMIIPITAGGLHYAAVIASAADSRDSEFNPVTGVQVKVGAAKKVMNLSTGQELPIQDGAVTFDLVGEPFAFLAMLDAAPQDITLNYPPAATAGDEIQFTSSVPIGADANAHVPVEYILTDPAGNVRAKFYRFSARDSLSYRIGQVDAAGEWTLTVKELLTGLSAQGQVKVSAAKEIAAVARGPEVFFPHGDRVELFMQHKGDVRVIVEETQGDLLPAAQRLVDALIKAGRPASIQRVTSESFDTLWLRWFPGKKEEDLLARIDAAGVVGYRGNLLAHIVASKREFVTDKGGWSDLAPMFVVRNDVIVFSGGRLAGSLRAVSDWMDTPNLPGKGQGVIEVALSPFWADRCALAVVANDEAGRAKAVDALTAAIAKGGKVETVSPFASPQMVQASQKAVSQKRVALDGSIKGLVPPALCQAISVAPDGHAAVVQRDCTAVVSPAGEVLYALAPEKTIATVCPGGRYIWGAKSILQRDKAWDFPTSFGLSVRVADPAGKAIVKYDVPETYERSLGAQQWWDSAFCARADGGACFIGQFNGNFLLLDPVKKELRRFDEPAGGIRYYEQTRDLAFVTSAAFSPGGKFLAFSIAARPTSYGGMCGPSTYPYCTSLRLIDADTGKTLWRLDGNSMRDTGKAAMNKCLAVSDDGATVAWMDTFFNAVIADASGKEIFRKPLLDYKARFGPKGESMPPPLKVAMTASASTLVFGADVNVLITDAKGKDPVDIVVPSLNDLAVAGDGSRIYASAVDGVLSCFDRKGKKLWELATQGDAPRIAIAPSGVMVAEGAGNLVSVSPDGKVLKTVALAAAKAAQPPCADMAVAAPALYRPPATLAVLQKLAGAKLVKAVELAGQPKDAYGLKFFPADKPVSVQLSAQGPHLVHIVYRKLAANAPGAPDANANAAQAVDYAKAIDYGKQADAKETKAAKAAREAAGEAALTTVTLASGKTRLQFVLDLPTPQYRAVDLPIDAKGDMTVTVSPGVGLELAELSVHSFAVPGVNAAYIKPPKADMEARGDIELKDKPRKGDDLDVLDDKDSAAVAKSRLGKVKDTGLFSINPDPDKVAGPYLPQKGNPLEAFDGLKFLEGKPSAWTATGAKKAFGTKIALDIGYASHPKLCLTYDRSMKQSEVMLGVAVMAGRKDALADPETLAFEPCTAAAADRNDQFFHAFDVQGAVFEVLGVYVYSEDNDDGLSEIELYE